MLGFILSINVGLWGLFDLKGNWATIFFNVLRSSLIGVLYFLPYLADRLIYPKFQNRSILSTLTFPVISTAIFFLSSLEGPFDGAVQISKFVYGPLVFKQMLSLFGTGSFVFITAWFAALISCSWENKFDFKKTAKPASIFLPVVLLIFVYGIIKISITGPRSNQVKIAAIIIKPEDGKAVAIDDIFAD